MRSNQKSVVLCLAAGLAMLTALMSNAGPARASTAVCPVTHQSFTDSAAHKAFVVDGKRVAFCCGGCPAKFSANPEKYLTAGQLGSCPVAHGKANKSAALRVVINNQIQYFCCPGCPGKYSATPSDYVTSLPDVVTGKTFKVAKSSPRSEYKGQVYLFASATNKAAFDKAPARYAVVFGKG